MSGFGNQNPIAVFVYFVAVLVPILFGNDLALGGLALLGAVVFALLIGVKRGTLLFSLVLLPVSVLINLLFSHNGSTVLFLLNDSPMTLESLLYGLGMGLILSAVFLWFGCFTRLMTSDRLLYVFGTLSPKAALVLSTALRYVPLFGEQARRIREAQRAIGAYRDGNILTRIRSECHVFSVMITWTLENGITTADSMTARGYGILNRRTRFARYRFHVEDTALLLSAISLCAATVFAPSAITYYPEFSFVPSWLGLGLYALLCALPTAIEVSQRIRWTCLLSRI